MIMLTISETAKRLNVHPQTVRNWIKKGKITVFQIDRSIRIPESVLEVLMGLEPNSLEG